VFAVGVDGVVGDESVGGFAQDGHGGGRDEDEHGVAAWFLPMPSWWMRPNCHGGDYS
jgi:hypothetical protein